MQPALLIIPKITGSINYNAYLNACIEKMMNEGFVPLTPCGYDLYRKVTTMKYIEQVESVIKAIYLFVDFGTDEFMNDVSFKYFKTEIEVITTRFSPDELKRFQTEIDCILDNVSSKSGISLEVLKGEVSYNGMFRKREVVQYRQFYFKYAKEHTKRSLADIGELVNKDHATVLHGIKTVNNCLLKEYEVFFGEREPGPEVKPEKLTAEILKRYRAEKKREEISAALSNRKDIFRTAGASILI